MNTTPLSTDPKVRRMEIALMSRLRTRKYAAKGVCQLDFRTAQFASLVAKHGDRMTLRDPDHPEWPMKGTPTTDRTVAERWIQRRYAPWIVEQLAISRVTPEKASITVTQAVQELLDELEKASVAAKQREGTFLRKDASLVSMLTAHVKRVLGPRLLTSLDGDTVHKAVNELTVKIKIRGQRERQERPADVGTKRRFLSAVRRVWKQVFPTLPPPFAHAHVTRKPTLRAVSTMVRGFEDHAAFRRAKNGSLEPSELLRLMAAAWYLDEQLALMPNIRGTFIPNTTETIAVSAGFGTRISEAVAIRWGHCYATPVPHVILHGAKEEQTNVRFRAVPMQLTLLPWLARLEACADIAALVAKRAHYNVFMLRTDPRRSVEQMGQAGTLSRRVSDALTLAKLKVKKKSTHGFRATFISMASASPLIDIKTVQLYAGHRTVPAGSSTDRYLTQLLELMDPAHQRLIDLPTPDEVREELERRRAEFDVAWPECYTS